MDDRPKRKQIPLAIKLHVFARQKGRCALTGRRLASVYAAEFDHVPALGIRPVAASGADYDPPQLDPEYLMALAPDAHRAKTSEDMGRIAKVKRQLRTQERHEHRMALKASGQKPEVISRWPRRPFPKQPQH